MLLSRKCELIPSPFHSNASAQKFLVGSPIAWTNPMGNVGITLKAKITGFTGGLFDNSIVAVGLEVEPMKQAVLSIPVGLNGGRLIITYQVFQQAVNDGTLVLDGAVNTIVNDATCSKCNNNRCSKTENSCWRCGEKL